MAAVDGSVGLGRDDQSCLNAAMIAAGLGLAGGPPRSIRGGLPAFSGPAEGCGARGRSQDGVGD
jgi:hypothetical protein